MSAELSRRLAKVIGTLSLMGLDVPSQRGIANRVEAAGDFSDLPESDRRAILAAEKISAKLASGELSFQDLLSQTEPGSA